MKLIGQKLFYFIILTTVLYLFSCSKSNVQNNATHSFKWTFDGKNYTANQDTAFTNGLGLDPYIIYAGMGTNYLTYTTRFYFKLSSFSVGSYQLKIGTSAQNSYYFIDTLGFHHSGISGTFRITANSGNKLSGSFDGSLNGPSGVNLVSGEFVNMPIKN